MEKTEILDALTALAHETRLDIVRLLVPAGKIGLPAGEIGKSVNVAASRLSFHLSALENAGLLASRREARNIIYSLKHQKLGALFGYLMNDCCGSHPEICKCVGLKIQS